MVKVLFITRKYPPATGGMELFAYDLSTTLAKKTPLKLVKWSGEGRVVAVLIALPFLFIKSLWSLASGGIDLIHVHDGVLAPLGLSLARLFRKPFVVVINGLETTYANPLYRVIVPPAVRRADAVICISRATAQASETKLAVPKNKVQIVPLAVRDEIYGQADRSQLAGQLNLPADSLILLSVGRLVRRKGVAWFVDNVLPGLVKDYPKLIYLVVGEGNERPAIEAAIRRHKLDSHVRLLGKAPDELLKAAYNGANVFVMPNLDVPGDMEGFGLVLLEASLCALPVVASGLEGINDAIIDGQNGVLVPPGDAAEMAARIVSFLEDPQYAHKFGQHSREYNLAHFQWDNVAERYIEIYRRLL